MTEIYSKLDIPLLHRAIKDRFPISEATRIAVVRGMHNILIDRDSTDGNKCGAAGIIARLDGLNLKQQQMLMPTLTLEGNTSILTTEEIEARIAQLSCESFAVSPELPEQWLPTESDPEGEPLDARRISEPESRYRGIGSTRAPRS